MKWPWDMFKKKIPLDELIGTWKTEDDLFFKIDIVYYLSFSEHGKGYYQTWCWTNGDNGEVTVPIEWKRLNSDTILIKKANDTKAAEIIYTIHKTSKQLELTELKNKTELSPYKRFWIVPKPLFKAFEL
ncbi:hypothetical protein [uncultured Psychroserpens sp.]|uniref:hypothetical protein n=1 Tax=uncultured Psychroserpens sp. TaxID=255436 RepID=UPI00262F96D2|nr:hypothetical protein [uncultured Psychroserpens sp.]